MKKSTANHFNFASKNWNHLEKKSNWYRFSELFQIELIDHIVSINEKVFLDVGTGIGTMALLAKLKGAKLSRGIDVSSEMIKIAQINKGMIDVEYSVQNAKNMNFDASSTDIIMSSAVTEIEDDLVKLFLEFNRVLKQDGKIFLLVVHNSLLNKIWSRLLLLLPRKKDWKFRYKNLRSVEQISNTLPKQMHVTKKIPFAYASFFPLIKFWPLNSFLTILRVESFMSKIFSKLSRPEIFSHCVIIVIEKR